jgi:hypothetical protein
MQCVQQMRVSFDALLPHGDQLGKLWKWSVMNPRIRSSSSPVPSAECQLQIRLRLASFDLTACRRLAISPRDALTARVGWCDLHSAARKAIAKHVTHIVPHLILVETVGENGLADIWLEKAALNWADFERDTTRNRVNMKFLAVRGVFGDGLLFADATTDRPQVDWLVALICDDRATDSVRTERKKKSRSSKRMKKHVQ